MPNNHTNKQNDILSVSELNQKARRLLEISLGSIRVEGEISNFTSPSSGHCYFTLKDQGAQIRCAMFRNRAQFLNFAPKEGDQVQIRGKVSLYENRGDYQLLVDNMAQAGDGALRQAYEQLKARLQSEGLFNPEHKLGIPSGIRHIGVVTSPTGAAVQDILSVLKRRFPAIQVSIYPCAVQGADASQQIADAIQRANRDKLVEVLIVGRGGGSLEDLWSFNEEIVARAIYQSRIPIVSAVGHETDMAISDYVADVRAPTPSAAAEMLSPNQEDWQASIKSYEDYFIGKIQHELGQYGQKTLWLFKRLRHPGHKLQEQSQRLDQLEIRLINAIQHQLQHQDHRLNQKQSQLWQFNPAQQLQQQAQLIQGLNKRLQLNMQQQLQQARLKLANSSHTLQTVSPLNTLARGYAIVQDETDKPVFNADQVKPGDTISARLHQGQIECTVGKVIA